MLSQRQIRDVAGASESRADLWTHLIQEAGLERMAEVGVFRGELAVRLLRDCESVKTYYMVDPWRHLDDWNKPANTDDERFEKMLSDVERKTEFAAERRVILRGKTTEVIDGIPDGSLDFAYIDGDHTLRGITIDLNLLYPKVRDGGWIGGVDFSATIWQQVRCFEPTLVFPYAVYFAEAVDAPIMALPFDQFLIVKDTGSSFEFTDTIGTHGELSLAGQLAQGGPAPSGGRVRPGFQQRLRRIARKVRGPQGSQSAPGR
jgi:hypothetical protein